jgi:hypothetical protein
LEKILHTYVKKFQFFPKSSIYDDDAKYRISEFNRHQATLYFIVRTKKVSFLPKSFEIGRNYTIRGKVEVAGKSHAVAFDTARMLHGQQLLKEKFKTVTELTDYCMKQWGGPAAAGMSNDQKYIEVSHVNVENSTADKLAIRCALYHSISQGRMPEMRIGIHQIINAFDVDCLQPLEILYIGKSNDDTWRRIYDHNKWGLLTEHVKQDDEFLVYFLEIDKSFLNHESIEGFSFIHRDESELSIETATEATEAALINYFIKHKKFNKEFVDSDITKTDLISKKVKGAGYTGLLAEVGLDGVFGKVGTADVGFRDHHMVQYTF